MPAERRRKLVQLVVGDANASNGHGGSSTDQVVTVVDLALDELVASAVAAGADPRLALARAANEAAASPRQARLLDPLAFAALLKMESSGQLSATQSKEVLAELIEHGGTRRRSLPASVTSRWKQGRSTSMVDDVIVSNPEEWERYRRRRRQGGAVPPRPGDACLEGPGERQGRGGAVRAAATPGDTEQLAGEAA